MPRLQVLKLLQILPDVIRYTGRNNLTRQLIHVYTNTYTTTLHDRHPFEGHFRSSKYTISSLLK